MKNRTMEDFLSLLEYSFFTNAIFAAVLTAISCGIAGTYLVSRRMVFIGGGITHASFGGIGLAWYFGINTILGASLFAILTGISIDRLSHRGSIRSDSVIAIMWSLGMAIGIIFIYLTPGYAPNLMTWLFGSILTVNSSDLLLLLSLSILLILFFTFFYRRIVYLSFDEEYARTRNIKSGVFNMILISLVSLTIVFNIKIAGIILLLSLLTIPQNAANLFTKDFGNIIFISILIGLAGSITGLILSYFFDIPSGATIIFSLVIIYVILRIIHSVLIRRKRKEK